MVHTKRANPKCQITPCQHRPQLAHTCVAPHSCHAWTPPSSGALPAIPPCQAPLPRARRHALNYSYATTHNSLSMKSLPTLLPHYASRLGGPLLLFARGLGTHPCQQHLHVAVAGAASTNHRLAGRLHQCLSAHDSWMHCPSGKLASPVLQLSQGGRMHPPGKVGVKCREFLFT